MKKGLSIKSKISIYVLAISIISSLVIGGFSYQNFKNNLINYLGARAKSIAQVVSASIDGDRISQYSVTGQTDDDYQKLLAFLDSVKKNTNLSYLYIMVDDGDYYKYIAEAPSDNEPSLLGDTDTKDQYGAEPSAVLSTGNAENSGVYYTTKYGSLISGFAPIFDHKGSIIGVIGMDIEANVVNDSINGYLPTLIGIVILSAAFSFILISLFVNRIVVKPIKGLQQAAQKLSDSKFDINIPPKYQMKKDEIGRLSAAFVSVANNTNHIINEISNILSRMSNKDMSIKITGQYQGDFAPIQESITNIVDTYNRLLSEFKTVSRDVSISAQQLSDVSGELALGSNTQSTAIEFLKTTISEFSSDAVTNALNINHAKDNVSEIVQALLQGKDQMKMTISAMDEINDSSNQISQIIKVIDDITFQTNILALNAAIEAARAGVAGKGFAVVAEEVRTLARKTSDAANKTSSLINTSINAIKKGSSITKQTASAIENAADKAEHVLGIIDKIASTSNVQASSITGITAGMSQISEVIQNNSAKAQESAALSEELTVHCNNLHEELSDFILYHKDKAENYLQLRSEKFDEILLVRS